MCVVTTYPALVVANDTKHKEHCRHYHLLATPEII